jgi:hypothetical protein
MRTKNQNRGLTKQPPKRYTESIRTTEVTQKNMRIEVTQKDIDYSERNDPCNCPVAMAVKRQLGMSENATTVIVGTAFIKTFNKRGTVEKIYSISKVMRRFIYKVDEWEEVQPQNFIVREVVHVGDVF